MKYLAFDLEIVKDIPEGDEWKEHRPLGISCAATIRSDDISPILWYHGQEIVEPKEGAMTRLELLKMVDYMIEQMSFGYIPLTWNGLGFDFDVLSEESGDSLSCKKIAMTHYDMMFHFLCIKGFPLSLKAASAGMGLEGKTEGMSGAYAPALWRDDNEKLIEFGQEKLTEMDAEQKRRYVLRYVGQDAIATLELAEAIDKAKKLKWTSKKGRPNSANFPDGFLSVRGALKLPRPAIGWMSNPIMRESFYEWTKE